MDRNRLNPFSIDYILSSQAAAKQQQQQLNLNTSRTSPSDNKHSQHFPLQPAQALPQADPNFIYSLACFLLQRQQQQQQLQQQLSSQQPQAPSHHLLQHHSAAAAAAQPRATLINPLVQVASGSFALAPNQAPSQLSRTTPSSPTPTTTTNTGNDQHNHSAHLPEKLDSLKPAHSYIGLIGMCILSSPEKRMVLNDIYQFILDNYPYYRNRGSGWRNSVRHNLSLNECFQKAGRAANGKGHYWTIHPANMQDFMMGDFRRRRAQRKVRRWNNMDVPSDESDDESMDDVNKPPLPEHFKRSIEMHKRLEMSYHKSALMAAAAAAAAAVAANQQHQHQPANTTSAIGALEAVTTAAARLNHRQSPTICHHHQQQ